MYGELFIETAVHRSQAAWKLGKRSLSLLINTPLASAGLAKRLQKAAQVESAQRALQTHSVLGELVIKSWGGKGPVSPSEVTNVLADLSGGRPRVRFEDAVDPHKALVLRYLLSRQVELEAPDRTTSLDTDSTNDEAADLSQVGDLIPEPRQSNDIITGTKSSKTDE